ncbi:MAG: hypothetical protein CR982_06235 [Candidatus Cloacimonadota bacterium]|nr:MAG: hypothetical protein CR982_06235 [Candidatus Cloacimonadota bacterium]PIE78119.1 MAG: hypothetical protein CSA15_09795 [Candidatus Delongbacteria bacterium]
MKYLLITFTILLLIGCNSKETYVIEKKDGLEIVKNIKRKMDNSKISYKFETISTLENREDSEYSINFPTYKMGRNFDLGVDIDEDLNFYLLDFKNYKVVKIDKEGKLIKSFGREGRGPGEFPFNPVVIDYRDKKVYVLDLSGRLTIFDKDGKFINFKPLEVKNTRAFYNFFKLKSGGVSVNEMYDGKFGSKDFKLGYGVVRLDEDLNGKNSEILYLKNHKFDMKNIDPENFIAGISVFDNNIAVAELSRNSFEINIDNLENGKKIKVIKPYSGIARDKEMLQKYEEALVKVEKESNSLFKFKKPDKLKKSISFIFHDEKGNLLASTDESIFDLEGHKFSVFDKRGVYRGDIRVKELNGMNIISCGDYCIATTSLAANYSEGGFAEPKVILFKLNLEFKE